MSRKNIKRNNEEPQSANYAADLIKIATDLAAIYYSLIGSGRSMKVNAS